MLLLHAGQPLRPHDLWSAWTFDVLVVVSLVASAVFYSRGVNRLWSRAGRGRGISTVQRALFWSGWLALVIALVSPLHALGAVLFSAHMTQHELLMVGAAPLLVLGQPGVAMAWAIPQPQLRRLASAPAVRTTGALWKTISAPAIALVFHLVILLVWHLPALYQSTLRSDAAHAAQHGSFVVSAIAFWWGLLRARRNAAGAAVAYLFVAMLVTGAFGALLTFASQLWYPAYASTTAGWGISALDDQRLGGMIMWIPGGLTYLLAALWLFSAWLREPEMRASS